MSGKLAKSLDLTINRNTIGYCQVPTCSGHCPIIRLYYEFIHSILQRFCCKSDMDAAILVEEKKDTFMQGILRKRMAKEQKDTII